MRALRRKFMVDILARRRAGVLLHPTSLPGSDETGTLGASAFRFVDFLRRGGFSVWQTLPLGPVDSFQSPYCLSSAYAGDVRLIDIDGLRGLPELPGGMPLDIVRSDPAAMYQSFRRTANPAQATLFAKFMHRHRRWLFAYGMFELCRQRFRGDPWWLWPQAFRQRDWDTLVKAVAEDKDVFRSFVFQQYLFELQWMNLKRYANEQGVFIFGDLPFYMDRNSVDVWWSKRFFALDENDAPVSVAGVPPDYFNEDGQLWGNPLYDWEALRADKFLWWQARIAAQLRRFDMLRIDHFRALESYWSVPANADTAKEGHWEAGCGAELLSSISTQERRCLVAEDLGIITNAVRELRDRFSLPGMAVLQFGFDGTRDNPHLPDNLAEHSIVYSGTHDNDTLLGWYQNLDGATRAYVLNLLSAAEESMPAHMIDVAYQTRAKLAVFPLQDLLGLDSSARMNVPGKAEGNWGWRFQWSQINDSIERDALSRARESDRLV